MKGLQAWHTCTYVRPCTHTQQQPHYASFRRGLCFVPLESDSDLWRRGVTLHPDTHSNTKQGYWPKHGYKERLLLHQQSHTDSSARCGLGSTPHQCNPTDEFSRPTKWIYWLLSITCFDEFHEYESLSASSLNDSLMTLPETLPMSYWVQVYVPVSGVIFCCITTAVLSKRWTLRGQTHPASQRRYAHRSARLSSVPSA